MKILLGSTSNVKTEALEQAFSEYFKDFEIISTDVESNVSNMPVNKEIIEGCNNRLTNLKKYAKEHKIEVDFYVAVEGGIFNSFGVWFMTNMAVIEDKKGIFNYGLSGGFTIPDKYIDEVKDISLHRVIEKKFGTESTRYNGAVSFLTKNKMNRTDETKEAILLALTKFINENW